MSPLQLVGPAVKFALRVGQRNRAPKHIALKLVAAILLGVAVIFMLISLHQHLRLHFSPVLTNAFFAGGFAVLAVVILLGVYIAQKRYRAPSFSEQVQEQVGETRAQFAGMQRELYRSVLRNEKTWMLGAAVLGLMLGANTRGKRRKPPAGS
ncbi:MAG: hypothetical protein Q4A06_08280 [Cardiobacteriaceae bacterium]|nr:hypothetical protein [Cardiobacteriaceae bacterium]